MAPGIFIVPGLYESRDTFAPLVEYLKEAGFPFIHVTTIVSGGTTSKRHPHVLSMEDDMEAIRSELVSFVEKSGNEGVILILHSAGGFLGSGAMKGLAQSAYEAEAKRGGVRQIVAFTAGLLPVGFEHQHLPFMEIDNKKGIQHAKDPGAFFNDMSAEDSQVWADKFTFHPAEGWGKSVKYCGWQDVPVDFIICVNDLILPAELQEASASAAEAKTYKLKAGHMPQLSKTRELGDLVLQAIKRLA
ncbi:hypothetical protein C8034_v005064 [Colletotrichum sidae]|uniref:AB hydrolase-1 domain-containing protein n=1 Tax=Colletotrichum sidae TaxID=1347389 RepID=A0A4R8SN19_9PEZI|nr:hypothetical protein C8034_v005064 [Colletotrichum sidae]